MCLVDIEKAFNRVPGKVMEWTMRNKGLPEVIVKAVMGLYLGAKMKVRVESWCASKICTSRIKNPPIRKRSF